MLTVVAFVKSHERAPKTITLVGMGGVPGAWAAAARAQSGQAIQRAAIDTAAFKFLAISDIYSPDLLPGGAKYGDVAGLLAVASPGDLWLVSESAESLPLVKSAYQAAGAADRLTIHSGPRDALSDSATAWLLK